MASKKKGGKTLVIVESPAKARTIHKLLGPDYVIEASVGHVRDLPANASEIPPEMKKEKWARLGIDIEHDFRPLYVIPQDKRKQIQKLSRLVKSAARVYLATDEDREGESISWHLVEVLRPEAEVRRLVFHEITKEAIRHALEHPRDIDRNLVEAQEARRLVDRLYGYLVSPLLWKKIKPKLSAGRVQSVAIRLVVEREKERMRFREAEYWDLSGRFRAAEGGEFEADLVSVGGRRVASGKDFDPETGRLRSGEDDQAPLHLDRLAAAALAERLAQATAEVESLEKKPFRERPAPPFTTSTLQQEAGKKLRFSAQRTMRAAQRLYENGYITYMRTDSTTLSGEALQAARARITEQFGEKFLPASPRTYRTKVRNAQEAHEAIRPAGSTFVPPDALGADMGADERKIYELVYRRTIASQMKDAEGHRTTLVVAVDDARFSATGKTITFPGFRLAYVEQEENGEASRALAEQERLLPGVRVGEEVQTLEIRPVEHHTQPPPRLTEASLVKELETRGIGRPSTYASIIETIQARDYCFKKGTALVPTFTAFAVVNLLDRYLHYLVDYAFTARMEDELDEISNGRKDRVSYLRKFYSGNGQPGLEHALVEAEEVIDPREVCSIPLGEDGRGRRIEVRVGRYGPYLECGETRVRLPEGLPPDELTLERALELLEKGEEGPRKLGVDPETGLSVYVKVGRFGPYFQLGDPEELDGRKPKMASLLAGMEPETVTLEDALAVLALPRSLGTRRTPDTDEGPGVEEEVVAANGRYGPYVRWGKETRSIPPEESPLTITLERAMQLLAEPKRRGRQRAAPKVLAELGPHPETTAMIRVLDGRYGPYVTDGETNASLPRGEKPEEVTLEQAVELLAEKAAQGRGRKKATKKKATKKATRKKTTKKAASEDR